MKLGILPGFGGTWRLPRLLGLARGIEFILSSRTASGKEALRMGLADALCFKEQTGQVAGELALKLRQPGFAAGLAKKRRSAIRVPMRLLGLPGIRRLLLSRARTEVIRKTGGLMPAPLRLLSVVAHSYGAAAGGPWSWRPGPWATCWRPLNPGTWSGFS